MIKVILLLMSSLQRVIPNYLKTITNNEIPFVDALLELTEKEVAFRNERASKVQIKVSAFLLFGS